MHTSKPVGIYAVQPVFFIQLHAPMAHAKNSNSTKIFIEDCKLKSSFQDYNFNLTKNKSHILYVWAW